MSMGKIKYIIAKNNFFDIDLYPQGSFRNDFIDNGNGTITDRATDLMWQKSGSGKSLDNNRIKKYIKELNNRKFAGYSSWRLPTVDELASLINNTKVNGVFLDPLFDNKQYRCWTIDPYDYSYSAYEAAFIINFKTGNVDFSAWATWDAAYTKNVSNYVRAVCSVQ